MTKKEYNKMDFEEFMEWAMENLNEVTTEDILKDFAINKLQNDDFGMALYIINAVYNNPYDTEYYRYDFSMGKLETPSPITEKADLEDLIDFEDKTLDDTLSDANKRSKTHTLTNSKGEVEYEME